MAGWNNETIKLVIAGVQKVVLLYLLWLFINLILTFTISNGHGEMFGYIDEFILGFVLALPTLTLVED